MNGKTLWLAVAALCCAPIANAKSIPGGKFYLSGNTAFSYSVSNAGAGLNNSSNLKDATTTSEAVVSGKLGYFLFSNFGLGLTASYNAQTIAVDTRKLTSLGGEGRIYIPLTSADIVRLLIAGGGEYTRGTATYGNLTDTLNGIHLHGEFGTAYSITESALFNITINYSQHNYTNPVYDQNGFSVGMGLDVIF